MAEVLGRAPLDLTGGPLAIHLVGIGGAGMSAIAEVLVGLGHVVSGSDRADSAVLARLRTRGIAAFPEHAAARVDGVDYVGVSTAIPSDNPEVVRAVQLGIAVGHRHDLLAAIGSTKRTLSISGTHGKTTTSALTALGLEGAGYLPSFIIGGDVAGFDPGARWTSGEWLVLEADESDSTFLAPPRAGAVVTNIEADHLDHHGDFAELVKAFERFVDETDGPVLVCLDDPQAAMLARREPAPGIGNPSMVTYGTADDADYRIGEVHQDRDGVEWMVNWNARPGSAPDGRDGDRQMLRIGIPGMHLVRNATAAFGLAVELGADARLVAGGIGRYQGVGRRFERRGVAGGVTFIDDYAHLPAEVRAVLGAASVGDWERIVCVFQPHRFSRTAAVWRDYATAFDGADVVVVTEIYAAGETPIASMTVELIVGAVGQERPDQLVHWMPTREDLVGELPSMLRPGDLCLTLGAGDLTTLPDDLIGRLGGLDDV